MESNITFYEWLGGLIDADGCFYISKKGYSSIEITLHEKEIQTLYKIKTICQGHVNQIKGVKAIRWRLFKRELVIDLLNKLSGHIRLEKRQLQYKKICQSFNIDYKMPHELSFNNAWFSGFFCGEGCIYINPINWNATISVSQKDKKILENIQLIYKGNIHYDISWNGWIWQSNNFKCDIILDYFDKNPLYNPYKQAKIRGFKRYLFYKKNKYHLDITKRKRLLHYIKLLNNI